MMKCSVQKWMPIICFINKNLSVKLVMMSFTLFYVSAAHSADCGLLLTFGQPLRNSGKFVARIIGRLNFVGAIFID